MEVGPIGVDGQSVPILMVQAGQKERVFVIIQGQLTEEMNVQLITLRTRKVENVISVSIVFKMIFEEGEKVHKNMSNKQHLNKIIPRRTSGPFSWWT